MPPVAAAGLSFDRKDSYELWAPTAATYMPRMKLKTREKATEQLRIRGLKVWQQTLA
jgi:hypothetical protein